MQGTAAATSHIPLDNQFSLPKRPILYAFLLWAPSRSCAQVIRQNATERAVEQCQGNETARQRSVPCNCSRVPGGAGCRNAHRMGC